MAFCGASEGGGSLGRGFEALLVWIGDEVFGGRILKLSKFGTVFPDLGRTGSEIAEVEVFPLKDSVGGTLELFDAVTEQDCNRVREVFEDLEVRELGELRGGKRARERGLSGSGSGGSGGARGSDDHQG